MTKSPALRLAAAALSLALLHASFGPGAWAQVVGPVAPVPATVGGASAAAGAAVPVTAGAASIGLPPVSPGLSPLGLAPAASLAPVAAQMPAAALGATAVSAERYTAAAAPAEVLAQPAQAVGLAGRSPAVPAPAESVAVVEGAAAGPQSGLTAAAGATPAAGAARAAPAAPRAAGVGAVVARRFAELKAFFAGRGDAGPMLSAGRSAAADPVRGSEGAEHASGLTPAGKGVDKTAQGGGDNAPPAPAAPKDEGQAAPKKGGFGWFGLGAAVATLIGAMLLMQVGLEAQGQAMAALTEKAFGDFSILAQVSIFAQLGSMVGQQLAQPVIGKLGLAKTYYAAHFLRAASIGTMIFLLGSGMMPLALMYLFYAANGVMTGIAATADGTMRKILIGSGEGRQEKFRTIWQFSAEVIGVIAPIVFGALVLSMGPSLVTAIYPAAIVAGLMLLIARKVLPKDAAAKLGEAGKKLGGSPGRSIADGFKGLWRAMVEGKNIVMRSPVLKYSFMGAALFDILNPFLYRLFAPGYGKMIAGAAGMSPVQGMIVGLFSLGGLFTAVMLLLMQRRMKAESKVRALAPEAAEDLQRKSVLRWMLLGVPAVLLLTTFAITAPTLGAVVALPSFLQWAGAATVPAVAMIVFGFFQVAASIKLNAFFVDNLPDPDADPANKEKVQKAIAFSGSAMTLLSIIGMFSMKPLFGNLAGFNPFPWIAAGMIPIALALFYLQRKLAAATRPSK